MRKTKPQVKKKPVKKLPSKQEVINKINIEDKIIDKVHLDCDESIGDEYLK